MHCKTNYRQEGNILLYQRGARFITLVILSTSLIHVRGKQYFRNKFINHTYIFTYIKNIVCIILTNIGSVDEMYKIFLNINFKIL